VLLLGEALPLSLATGLVLVMIGVTAMTSPAHQIKRWLLRPCSG
jgi:hypothetical protein